MGWKRGKEKVTEDKRIKMKRVEEKSPTRVGGRKERTAGWSEVHLGKIQHGYKYLNYLRCA